MSPAQAAEYVHVSECLNVLHYWNCVVLFAKKEVCQRAGKWTVQQAAELAVAAPTIEAALDGRFMSGLKEDRVAAAKFYEGYGVMAPKTPEARPATRLHDCSHAPLLYHQTAHSTDAILKLSYSLHRVSTVMPS